MTPEPDAGGASGASPPSATRFDRDTAVRPLGEGAFEAHVDRGWWIVRGPNGGYLAAILLRALGAAVADPERLPRSLTIHYTRPPAEGPVRIETRLERAGRSLSTASARMLQDGTLQALALAAFSKPRAGAELHHAPMPEVAPPEAVASRAAQAAGAPALPMRERYEQRWALGAPPGTSGSSQALSGGWIRLAEPRALDALLVAALTDAWPPAVFSSSEIGRLTGGVPTVDLTVHFRAPLPLAAAHAAGEHPWVLAAFRSRVARDGFVEEDGELWSRDGTLLAQSRQLAVLG